MKRFAFLLAILASLLLVDVASAQCASATTSTSACATAQKRHGVFYRIKHRNDAAMTAAQSCTSATVTYSTRMVSSVSTAPKLTTTAPLAVLTEKQKSDLMQLVASRAIAAGRITAAEYSTIVASQTKTDGTVNWTGVIAFFNAIVADLPQILALIQALLPLFGG